MRYAACAARPSPRWCATKADQSLEVLTLDDRYSAWSSRQAMPLGIALDQDLESTAVVSNLRERKPNLSTRAHKTEAPVAILKSRWLLLPLSLLPISGGCRWLCVRPRGLVIHHIAPFVAMAS
jgi:hypothetical protein